ncbi:MAG: ClbS/DfsB family four-helix bundle protein [Chloroflexota bacterium]|nr:ClbS/DfsB family four-helix bundle protein [Chloroflexota bacterium]
MELKSKLVELIESAFKEEQTLFDNLSEDERSVAGEPDRWSPKDVIAHLSGWKTRLAENLAAAASGGTVVRYADFEAVNAKEFEERRDWSWSKVMEEAAEACQQLVEQVEARSEDELRGTETLPWQEDRPLWRLIVGNGYIHPVAIHLSPIYIERGEKKYATELQEEAANLLGELDESASWQGTLRYNLACHYALLGETERAIKELEEALEMNPGLIEWSKEDSDLASIREEPGYLALCAE